MHTIEGVITIVQESRFQLTDAGGVSHLFILGSHSLAEPDQLPALRGRRVRVDYKQPRGVIGLVARSLMLTGN